MSEPNPHKYRFTLIYVLLAIVLYVGVGYAGYHVGQGKPVRYEAPRTVISNGISFEQVKANFDASPDIANDTTTLTDAICSYWAQDTHHPHTTKWVAMLCKR